MDIFPTFFFRPYRPGKCLYHILERKNAFLGYKNKKFKKSKNRIFPKGLTLGFGPKIPIIPIVSFLGNMGQENVFYDILFYEKSLSRLKKQEKLTFF